MTTPITYPDHLQIEPFNLRVRGEPVGIAVGVENWFRATQFLCFKNERQAPAPHLRPRMTLEPSIWDLAKGTTGCGDDDV
jgi:hypothetical protein